jgi:hypothetical protein
MADHSEHSASKVDYTYADDGDDDEQTFTESHADKKLAGEEDEYADEFDSSPAPAMGQTESAYSERGGYPSDTGSQYTLLNEYQRALQDSGLASPDPNSSSDEATVPPSTNYDDGSGATNYESDYGQQQQEQDADAAAWDQQNAEDPSASHSSSPSFDQDEYIIDNAAQLTAADFAIYAAKTQQQHEARRIAAAAGTPISPIITSPTRGRKQTVAPIANSSSSQAALPVKPAFSGSTFFGSGVKHNQWPQSSTDSVTAQQQKKVKKLPKLEPTNSRHIFAGGTLDFSAATEEKNDGTFVAPGSKKVLQLNREMLSTMTTPLNPVIYEPRLSGPALASSSSAPKLNSQGKSVKRGGAVVSATSTATLSRPDPNVRLEDIISLKDQLHAEKRKVSAQERLMVQLRTEMQKLRADGKRKDKELIHVLSRKIGEGADTPAGGLQLIKSERLLIASMVEKLADIENKLESAEEAKSTAEKTASETAHKLSQAQQSATFYEAEAKRLVDLLARAKAHRDLGKYLSSVNGELGKAMSPSQGGAGAVPPKDGESPSTSGAPLSPSSSSPSLSLSSDPSVHQTLIEFHQSETRSLLAQNKGLKEELAKMKKQEAKWQHHESELVRHLKESRSLIQITFVENENLRKELARAQSALKQQSHELRHTEVKMREYAKNEQIWEHQRMKMHRETTAVTHTLHKQKEKYLSLAIAYRAIGGKFGAASGLSAMPSEEAELPSETQSRSHSTSPVRASPTETAASASSGKSTKSDAARESHPAASKAASRESKSSAEAAPASKTATKDGQPPSTKPPMESTVKEPPSDAAASNSAKPSPDASAKASLLSSAKASPREKESTKSSHSAKSSKPASAGEPKADSKPAKKASVVPAAEIEDEEDDDGYGSDQIVDEPEHGKPMESGDEDHVVPEPEHGKPLGADDDDFVKDEPEHGKPASVPESDYEDDLEAVPDESVAATKSTTTAASKPSSAGKAQPAAAPAAAKEDKPSKDLAASAAESKVGGEKPKSAAAKKPAEKTAEKSKEAEVAALPPSGSNLTVAVSTVPSRPVTPQKPAAAVIPPRAPVTTGVGCETCTGGAIMQCVDCESPFCQTCFEDLHKTAKLAKHKHVPLDAQGKPIVEAEDAKPTTVEKAVEKAAEPKAAERVKSATKSEPAKDAPAAEPPVDQKPKITRTQSVVDVLASRPKKQHTAFDEIQEDKSVVPKNADAPLCSSCASELASMKCEECKPTIVTCRECDEEVHHPKALRAHHRKPLKISPEAADEEIASYAEIAAEKWRQSQQLQAEPGTVFVLKTADPDQSPSLLCQVCNELTTVFTCPSCREGRQRLCADCDATRHAAPKYSHHSRTPIVMDKARQTESPAMRSTLRADQPLLPEEDPEPLAPTKLTSMVACELCDAPADVWCEQCDQDFCEADDAEMHRPAKLAVHKRVKLGKAAQSVIDSTAAAADVSKSRPTSSTQTQPKAASASVVAEPRAASAEKKQPAKVEAKEEKPKPAPVVVRMPSSESEGKVSPEGSPNATSPAAAPAAAAERRSSRNQPHDSGGSHSVPAGSSPPSNYRPSSRTPSAPSSPVQQPQPQPQVPRQSSRSGYRAGSPAPGPSSRVPKIDVDLEPLVSGPVLAAAASPLNKSPSPSSAAQSTAAVTTAAASSAAPKKEQLGGDLDESSSDNYSSDDE